ncbi:MAG: iron-sulfur cluster assembly scaffold protein, partial [Chloroflexi bacterium]|nr:iron-sulfur cluster assembly scaffold protein [Chloroflexota bacterium]
YEDENAVCGDTVHLTLKTDAAGIVTEVGWDGDGCAISQASASLLYEELMGKSLDEIKAIGKEELLEMLGISLSMTRMKCAMLSLKVLKAGAYGIQGWPGE